MLLLLYLKNCDAKCDCEERGIELRKKEAMMALFVRFVTTAVRGNEE